MRKITAAVAMLAFVAAAVLVPARTALADHEDDCAMAFASGRYNVIIGSGNIQGTGGDDLIFGSSGNDNINAGGGNDVVCGRGGSDNISGGGGDDLLIGDACDGCEAITGSANGTPGNDSVSGGGGNDELYGDGGTDSLDGGSGNDEFFGGGGNDFVSGGSGNDAIDCDSPLARSNGAAGTADSADSGSGNDTNVANSCESFS